MNVEQVLQLAPDSSSAAAGRKLAALKHWPELGRNGEALWGKCQGSAVYQVRVDLSNMGYSCSCPSRKFPCKHVLGLMLLAAESPEALATRDAPEGVDEWLAKRRARDRKRMLPIPELNTEVQATKGFNVIATANNRDKGVNELSSALMRRFNTVVLPVPESLEDEVTIVNQRAEQLGRALELPAEKPALEEIRRVVTIFRELRNGVTEDGKTKLKSPSGTLSTAEAISVVSGGMAMCAYYGDGALRADDIISGLIGAVVKDPVQDQIIWQEYLQTVVKERSAWKDLYRASRDFS